MTNLRKHCLIASTDGKNENGCVSNEKTLLALICQSSLQANPITVPTLRFVYWLSVVRGIALNFKHLIASLRIFNNIYSDIYRTKNRSKAFNMMNDTFSFYFYFKTAIICSKILRISALWKPAQCLEGWNNTSQYVFFLFFANSTVTF